MDRNNKLLPIKIPSMGKNCPKCGKPMQRFVHGGGWIPKPGKSYFKYWDRCLDCKHLQNHAKARIHVEEVDK